MNGKNFSKRRADVRRRLRYVSTTGRALSAGAASAATVAMMAFVMVILPPMEIAAVSLAAMASLNANGIA